MLFSQTLTLNGKVPTEFSEGYEERALTLQKLVTNAETFYEKIYPQCTFKVKLRVFGKTDWKKLPYPMPYGLPHFRTDKVHRFWGLYVHVCKQNTLLEAYQMVKRNNGAPGIDGE